VRDRRETGSDVRLDHPPTARHALINEHLQGIVRRAPGPEPEAARQEVRPKTGSSTIFSAACTIRSRTAGIDSGLISSVPGLGYQHPPGGQSDLVNARRAVVPAHQTHARHRTSLRMTLSISAWNLRPGSALAAR